MTCWAPRAPEGCEGDVGTSHSIPLCEAHSFALINGSKPWASNASATEWLSANRPVFEAQEFEARVLALEAAKLSDPLPEYGKERHGFEWIGGKGPLWDTDDGRERYAHLSVDNAGKVRDRTKPREKRWNPNAWYMKFRKKKKAAP